MDFKTIYLILAGACVCSQVPHAYWSINKFSQIEQKWLKVLQNVSFCAIISIGIIIFALDGKHWFALGGAAVEVIINMYYFDNSFKERELKTKLEKHWLAYFLAILIPMSIFTFSFLAQ